MAKKKRKKKRKPNYSASDVHHILWQARHYERGWCKALRNCDYLKIRIPRDTLHRSIHRNIADIPNPGPVACKDAMAEIKERLDCGEISMYDTFIQRIDTLLDIWNFDEHPLTVLALIKQRSIVKHFYKGD